MIIKKPKGTYKLLSIDPKWHWYHLQYPDGHIVEMRFGQLNETEVTWEHVKKATHRSLDSNPHIIINREFYYDQDKQEQYELTKIFLEELKNIEKVREPGNEIIANSICVQQLGKNK
jgi:hypothetical protein